MRAERLAALAANPRGREVARLDEDQARALLADWRFWARPAQLPPPGDWRVWLVMAGRGFGKTRAGAEWVRGVAETDPKARIALVAATLDEGRRVMVEGESGLLVIAPAANRPRWEPSRRRLRWENGAEATLYAASEPEALRGPQHGHAWADEIGKWGYGIATWDNLALGLRLGDRPRVVATTTPRPVPLIRAFDRLKAEMEQGFSGSGNAGRPMLLEGGLRWQALSMSPADMDFVGLKAAAAREIALAFGVPPMLLGLPGDATYANYTEANRALWRLTVIPLARKIVDAVAEGLSAWWPGLVLALDLDAVPALAADRERLWAMAGQADFLSIEEKRQMLGFGKRP